MLQGVNSLQCLALLKCDNNKIEDLEPSIEYRVREILGNCSEDFISKCVSTGFYDIKPSNYSEVCHIIIVNNLPEYVGFTYPTRQWLQKLKAAHESYDTMIKLKTKKPDV